MAPGPASWHGVGACQRCGDTHSPGEAEQLNALLAGDRDPPGTTGGINHLSSRKEMMARLIRNVAEHRISLADALEIAYRHMDYLWSQSRSEVLDSMGVDKLE